MLTPSRAARAEARRLMEEMEDADLFGAEVREDASADTPSVVEIWAVSPQTGDVVKKYARQAFVKEDGYRPRNAADASLFRRKTTRHRGLWWFRPGAEALEDFVARVQALELARGLAKQAKLRRVWTGDADKQAGVGGREVWQVDERGVVVEKFASSSAAERAVGATRSSVSLACKLSKNSVGKHTVRHRGYFWYRPDLGDTLEEHLAKARAILAAAGVWC